MQSSIFLSSAGIPALSLAVGTALFTGTEYCLKRTVDTGDWSYFPTAMVLSVIANAAYLFVIKEYGLATAFIAATAALSIATILMGIYLFSEDWSYVKSAALLLFLIATVLLALPENFSFSLTKGG